MDLSFLVGQIELMMNLLQRYFEYVKFEDWELLAKTIEEKKKFLENIVDNSDKLRFKEKVEIIFPKFLDLLEKKVASYIEKAA